MNGWFKGNIKKNLQTIILVLTIAFVGISLGCGTAGGVKEAAVKKPQVGEPAVFRLRGTSYDATYYLSGVVQKIDGDKYEIMRDDNNLMKADAPDVYAFPKVGSKIEVKVGDYVVANFSDRVWVGGEVSSVSESVVEVKTKGRSFPVIKPKLDKIIKVSPEATAEIKDFFAK